MAGVAESGGPVKPVNGDSTPHVPAQSANDVIARLEQRYITLLEDKIARLEAEAKPKDETPKATEIDESKPMTDGETKEEVIDEKKAEAKEKDSVDSEAKDEKSSEAKNDGEDGETKDEKVDEGIQTDASKKEEADEKKERVRYCKQVSDELYGTKDVFIKKPKEADESADKGAVEDDDKDKDEGYAIAWRLGDGEENRPTLLIESKGLRQALKSVEKGGYNQSWESSKVPIVWPYELIYHNEAGLREYAKTSDERTKEDVEILIQEVAKQLKTEQSDAKKLSESGHITYDLLWTLYYPGQQIVKKDVFGKSPALLIVSSISIPTLKSPILDSSRYYFRVWSLDYDGTNYVYCELDLVVKYFKGTKGVTDLDLVPLDKWSNSEGTENGESLVEKLTERGRKFEALCNTKPDNCLRQYEGPIMNEGKMDMLSDTAGKSNDSESMSSSTVDLTKTSKENNVTNMSRKDRVIIDHLGYLDYARKPFKIGDDTTEYGADEICGCSGCEKLRVEKLGTLPARLKSGKLGKLTDSQLRYCPPRCFGFSLREKTWSQFLVDRIEDLDQAGKEDAFRLLELDAKSKEILKTLVLQHTTSGNSITDIIPGKGEGLIVLLHGPPGVGKTLTAESLAILSGKPLYTVSMMDVGTSPVVVEQNLLTVFQLATHWNALLLFDEADIFLETRSLQDLQRNSLVSVLLRILEFFRGILFLTSNRVKTFDEAFQSRINLAVRYKELEASQRRAIWRFWLNKASDDLNDIDEFEEELEEGGDLIKAELNGRQIRNVFRSSMAMAQSRVPGKRKLKLNDVQRVLSRTVEFQTYMAQSKELAAKQGIR